MDQTLPIRALMFVLVGPALVLALWFWLFGGSVLISAEDFLLTLLSVYFVLSIPALIMAQLDQMLADRRVRLRALLVALLPCAIGYGLIGLLALRAPQALSEFSLMPLVFALPFGFCSWASGRLR